LNACRHFGLCGGCSLQNLSPEDYRAAKRHMVVSALARAGLGDVAVAEPVIVPERSRRRAVFKLAKHKGEVEAGFHAARSHAIVDMRECLVLTPALFELAQIARSALAPILNEGEKAELHVTETDTGLDLAVRSLRKLTPVLTGELARAFRGKGMARIIFNNDVVMENAAPAVSLGGATTLLPPHAFLQATREGEAALQSHVLALTKGAKHVADLFAGLGTFTFALARQSKVHAVEQDGAALAALAAAARAFAPVGSGAFAPVGSGAKGLKPITTEKRDLFKQPLAGLELKPFDAVLLDPPRAGAEAQARALAVSKVARIAYVSCDAASFARDAAILKSAGFVPGPVTPIDQFLYSGHIELVAGFGRKTR
jgi:23S rRNA (uracil1939-C5)-methyltransferase